MKQQARQHKRHTDGSLDIEHYVKQGRILRAWVFTAMFKRVGRLNLTQNPATKQTKIDRQ
jgi:hypothetical protein